MATTLKASIAFVGVAAGATAALPHTLNVNGIGATPDKIEVDNGDFTVVGATGTTVTVRNNSGVSANVNALVEHWHTFERVFGAAGVTALSPQPFVPASGGIGGGVAAATFVYQPGGTAAGNVFTSWPALVTALGTVRGLRTLEFDASFVSPAVIPAGGPYPMTDVIWKAHNDQATAVDVAIGASFAGLRNFVGQLTVRNLNTVTSPVTDIVSLDTVTFDGASVECGAGAVPFFDLTSAGGAAFIIFTYKNGGSIGLNPGGGVPVIGLGIAGLTLFNNIAQGGPQRNSISGPAGSVIFHQITSHHAVLGPQPAFLGSTSIFVTATGPRHDILPGPGSTPFVAAPGSPITPGQIALGDVSGGAFAITLSTLPGTSFNSQGLEVIVKETSSTVGLTVAPGGANTIDGVAAAVAVPAGGALRLISDGVSNWILV